MRSKTVNEFWKKHLEKRKEISQKRSGKGNGMYGRRKMHLISNPQIKVLVKQEDIQHYIDIGYTFNNPIYKNFYK